MTAKELELKEKREREVKNETTYSCKVFVPSVDIFENEHEIILEADIPGVDKKDVKVQLENNRLSIEAKIRPEEYDGMRALYGEYNVGHYYRDFQIGELVEQNKINATVDNGVLVVTLPKAEKVKPRQITIL